MSSRNETTAPGVLRCPRPGGLGRGSGMSDGRSTLTPSASERMTRVLAVLQSAQHAGHRLGASVDSAAFVVTEFYKGALPFVGEAGGFEIRKQLARHAARLLIDHVALCAPSRHDFVHGEQLWFALCNRGDKQAYAQFSDYVEAAFILGKSSHLVVRAVAVAHGHIPYVLNSRSPATMARFITCRRFATRSCVTRRRSPTRLPPTSMIS